MATALMISLTNVKTGEVKVFGSMIQAGEFLGRSKMYIKTRIDEYDKVAIDKNRNEYTIAVIGKGKKKSGYELRKKPYNPENAKYAGYKPAQLCYECARAVGFCSWSRKFEPVPGWTAKPTKISHFKNKYGERIYVKDSDSYHITECPLFIRDGETKKEIEEQRKMLREELANECSDSV